MKLFYEQNENVCEPTPEPVAHKRRCAIHPPVQNRISISNELSKRIVLDPPWCLIVQDGAARCPCCGELDLQTASESIVLANPRSNSSVLLPELWECTTGRIIAMMMLMQKLALEQSRQVQASSGVVELELKLSVALYM